MKLRFPRSKDPSKLKWSRRENCLNMCEFDLSLCEYVKLQAIIHFEVSGFRYHDWWWRTRNSLDVWLCFPRSKDPSKLKWFWGTKGFELLSKSCKNTFILATFWGTLGTDFHHFLVARWFPLNACEQGRTVCMISFDIIPGDIIAFHILNILEAEMQKFKNR